MRRLRDELFDAIDNNWDALLVQIEDGHQPTHAPQHKLFGPIQPPLAKPPYNARPEEVWIKRMALLAHATELHRPRGRAVKSCIRDDLWSYYYEKKWNSLHDTGELQNVYQHAKRKLEDADEHTLVKVKAKIDEVKAKM